MYGPSFIRRSMLMKPINIFEYEALARERLPKMAFDYYASGAHDERTLEDNRS